jgi:CheY-specific phosphatase CheX
MDPLLDEKFILTISQILPEFMRENLRLSAEREAYGPSKNEGICFENCTKIGFFGEVNGAIYLCMDGYTKLKMLPRIAASFGVDPTTQTHSGSIVLEFVNQIAAKLVNEMKQGRFEIEINPPENLNHKLIPVDLKRYRQYILIFFLKDKRGNSNLGRLSLILLMEKYPHADQVLT